MRRIFQTIFGIGICFCICMGAAGPWKAAAQDEVQGAEASAVCLPAETQQARSSTIQIAAKDPSKLTETSVRINGWCKYSSGKPKKVGLYMGTSTSNMKSVGSDVINHNKNPFDIWYDIKNLKKGTTYYYKLYAQTGDGVNHWTKVYSFTTPHTHEYTIVETTKAPTCEEDGIKTYTCAICGDSYTESIPAKGHAFGKDWKYDGTGHWHECTCGVRSQEAEHTYTTEITKQPTETESGIRKHTCTVCGYSFTESLAPLNGDGWYLEAGSWVYYENGFKVTEDWRQDTAGWCYLDASGHMASSRWAADSQGWCYLDETGHAAVNRWMADSYGWCYLDGSGRMAKNCWIADSQGWCYLDENGYMATNRWAQDSAGWCYLDESGHLAVSRWMLDSVGWCYLDDYGHMAASRWVQDAKGWCYLDSYGRLAYNCWMQDSVGWCYLGRDGRMVRNQYVADSSGPQWIGPDGYVI